MRDPCCEYQQGRDEDEGEKRTLILREMGNGNWVLVGCLAVTEGDFFLFKTREDDPIFVAGCVKIGPHWDVRT